MKIAIYTKGLAKDIHANSFIELCLVLKQKGHQVFTTSTLVNFLQSKGINQILAVAYFDKKTPQVDMLICIGGDGTILDALSIVRDSGIPVLGLNTGRLGFLASEIDGNLETVVNLIEKNSYSIDSRTLLALESSNPLFDFQFGLNDFVVHKKETSSMIVVHTYLNGEFMNSYWADGLILSTPSGSTGYSLSCGGPIIFPTSESLIITPIAPHNLNVRPVVISDNLVVSFEIEGRANSYMVGLDSRSVSISKDTQLAVRKANYKLNLVRLPQDIFMSTLRDKLHWGLDKRN